ncbi:MAG: tetratricopeptide repeat protein [Bryobacteraceae bacterium]
MELQREIAILEEQLRTTQKSIEDKLAELTAQSQQATQAAGKTNDAVGGLEKRLDEQAKSLTVPVANIGSKVDQMTGELQALRESVGALNARFGKLEQQMLDMSTALKTLQSPPSPPEPLVSAETLFQSAVRDRDGGNLDLALKEFTDYVENFGATYQAPAAQFYIGDIHYRRGEFGLAVNAFDLVLEKYPEHERTPDAHYMKGMALIKMGETAMARSEFNTLIKRFPNSELAGKAKGQLKALPAPARAAKPKAK